MEKLVSLSQEEKQTTAAAIEIRKYKISCISKCLRYATQEYNCSFPKKYAEKLYNLSYKKAVPDYKLIDALVKEWNIWKPYVTEDSFSRFIKVQLERIFANQVAVTFSHSSLRGYIGNKATVVEVPDKVLITTVFSTGEILVNGDPLL